MFSNDAKRFMHGCFPTVPFPHQAHQIWMKPPVCLKPPSSPPWREGLHQCVRSHWFPGNLCETSPWRIPPFFTALPLNKHPQSEKEVSFFTTVLFITTNLEVDRMYTNHLDTRNTGENTRKQNIRNAKPIEKYHKITLN